jgi:hypothetical protein
MTGMDWHRLARAIVDRRVELGLKTREALLAVIKDTKWELSRRVLADLETGRRENYDQATLSRLEKALEWPQGEVYRVLRGIEALPTEPVDITPEMMSTAGVHGHLYAEKMDLAHLIANSPLDANQRFAIIREHRRRQNEFTRAEEQRIAEEIEKLTGQ